MTQTSASAYDASEDDHDLSTVHDFGDAAPRRGRSLLRPLATAAVAGVLSLAVAAGVFAAAASHSESQATGRHVVDQEAHDASKAKPVNGQLDAQQRKQVEKQGVTEFGPNGTSANRSAVRTELLRSMSAAQADIAKGQELEFNTSLTSEQAKAEAARREAQLIKDIANAKKQSAKVKAEQAAAVKKLKGLAGRTADATPVELSQLSSLDPNSKATLPVAAGTLGRSFGSHGSHWARGHTGQDFVAASGTPILAAVDGVVGNPTGGGWAGNNVVIHHANQSSTLYAHMSRVAARPGAVVKAGQVIGYVGSTGNSTGPHLHFEYYPPGTTPGSVYDATDPMAFLRANGVKI